MSESHLSCVDGADNSGSRATCGARAPIDEQEAALTAMAEPAAGRPWLSAKDYALLAEYLERYAERDMFVARLIRAKLDRALVVFSDCIDPALATLNSRILFRVAGQAAETRTLVRWDREPDVGISLAVTTCLGIALLGARAGETVEVAQRDRPPITVTLEDVAYQPEAARRRTRTAAAAHVQEGAT
jgi:regulator of nucleoside diphosphate kinase